MTLPFQRFWTGSALVLTGCLGIASLPPAQAEPLYKLETECSFKGGAAVPCTVEANSEGKATVYRHTAGSKVLTIRISDDPSRIEVLNTASGKYETATSAGARFSVNTICFNGRDFCVVNPNYLNSIRQDSPQQFAGRDLVGVQMNSAGRINVICYDDGCDSIKKN